ncbi:hypothetical protein P8864_10390 [Priestia flexa]|uniref:hypothetical protein n=1 Tax=Priestia flexa TaxID=86664 RepID=UPI000C23CC36|nr:hypothetical protein [Priestia flexa]MEC0666297.1 hypothetical protein [Priestia flexa]
MTIEWKEWNEKTITDVHGDIYLHRDLYEGNHAAIFPRAEKLIKNGEITDQLFKGYQEARKVQTPYIQANLCKLIAEVPAMLVARSIGKVTSSIPSDERQTKAVNETTDELIDGAEKGESSVIEDAQSEVIRQIVKNSKLDLEHWSNIVQHQVDGGLVGVPFEDEKGLRIEFKSRDVYFPHEDGLGADLAYKRTIEGQDYIHVYRERVEGGRLTATHLLYELNGSQMTQIEDDAQVRDILKAQQLVTTYNGRSQLFIQYWGNQKTFINPLGVSALRNQYGKQDEINWRLTQTGIVFERNSKPRIAISEDTFTRLEQIAMERYGEEEGRGRIDHEFLEVTTFDKDTGKAMEVIQVDVKNIGGLEWAQDIMKTMLMETQTSEKALDFYKDASNNSAVSGVAKFYDLYLSITKAERIQQEYVYFLKQLLESCLWLQNKKDPAVLIEEPDIALNEMVPVTRTDLVTENLSALEAGGMSLETFVRRTNPTASEEWIVEELERIEMEKQTVDSVSILSGPQTADNLNDNRDENGEIIESDDE